MTSIRVAIDTETTGLNVWTGARPFAVSACFDDGETLYWEFVVNPKTRRPMISRKAIREIRNLCEDPALQKYFWNARFDINMLRAIGVTIGGRIDEVSWMARSVNNLEFSFALKPLAKKYLNFKTDDLNELREMVVRARRLAKKLGWSRARDVAADYWLPHSLCMLAPDEAASAGVTNEFCEEYAIGDAQRTIELADLYEFGMDDLGCREVYERELSYMPITMEMERRGVRIDPERMKSLRVEALDRMDTAMDFLQKKSGNEDFNPNSSKQVSELLFKGDDALPIHGWTQTGQPQTGIEALVDHKTDERVRAILTHRAAEKAISTFFDKYSALATNDDDGMILHPGFNQWGTLTGRYSCSDPNLQQVSNPDTSNSLAAEFMMNVREVFVPRKGRVWYCPDYSQLEVIIFAHIAQEPTLIDAILRGDDIHSATVEKVWGGRGNPRAVEATMELLNRRNERDAVELLDKFDWTIEAVEAHLGMKRFRKLAKSVTFTKIFGGGPNALVKWINVPREEAVRILNQYDAAFPDMAAAMREIEKVGRADGYVINPFGRRLEVDRFRAYAAINHLVQSAAADLMKMGMAKCHAYLKDLGIDAYVLMTIHDELIFEFRKGQALKTVLRGICKRMSDHEGALCVPTPVDIERVDERWSVKTKVRLAA